MKIIEKSKSEGFVRIKVENSDDLWYLEQVVGKGDEVKKRTMRTMLDGREKKSVVLKLRTEKTELQEDRFRITGEIVEGAENIELGYHTFNVEEEDELSIWKEFNESDWKVLEKAESNHSYRVLFCIVEDGKADFYEVRESGITGLSKVSENIPGKMYEDQKKPSFKDDVINVINRTREGFDAVVIAGPGFFKNNLVNEMDDTSNIFVRDTSVTGETGLNEAIKRGALKEVVNESRISEETAIMEDFFQLLEKDEKVSYGEPVKKLVEQGAVEKLLLTPEKYREEQETVKKAEQTGAEVLKVHDDHEAGERLKNLGGIAAILRYNPQGLD